MPISASQKPALRVWRHRDYALYESGMTVYSVTGWMQRVGVGWLGWELTHSTFWLGILAAADLGPMIFLAPFAGAIADRVDSWKLTRLAQFLLMLQAIALSALVFSGWITPYLLLAASLYSGTIYPFSGAARQTLITRTVPHDEFPTAVALDSALFQLSRFIGPALASLVIPVFGVGGAMIWHAGGSITFQTTIALMNLPPFVARHRPRRHILADVGESLAYVRDHAGIFPIFLMLTIVSVLIRPIQDMLPGFAGNVFHGGAVELAWLTSSMGIGAMISAAIIASRGRVAGLTQRVFLGFAGIGVSVMILIATDRIAVGIICSALIGYTFNSMSTSTQALVQTAVANDMRGRVMSLYLLVFRGMPALGSVIDGLMARAVGLRMTFLICAVLCLCVWALAMPRRHAIAKALEHPGGP
jgi:MFS family permease